MNQYKNQFGTTRIADSPADRIITTWPATAKHILVIFRDQLFKVQVLGDGGGRVPLKAIEQYVRYHKLSKRVNVQAIELY
jgi:carnitine O-acetyltransferase